MGDRRTHPRRRPSIVARGPRRRVRPRLHVGHDERAQGCDAHASHAARRGRAHPGLDHAGRAEPHGLAGHPRHRDARRGARADDPRRAGARDRPVGSRTACSRSCSRPTSVPGPVPPCSSRASSTIRTSPRSTPAGSGGSGSAARRSRSRSANAPRRTGSRSCARTARPSTRRSPARCSTIPRPKRHATDGRPMPGVEIRLRDDDGVPVPPVTPGEIWSRGPDLCVGYTDAGAHGARLRRRRLVPDRRHGRARCRRLPHDHRPASTT